MCSCTSRLNIMPFITKRWTTQQWPMGPVLGKQFYPSAGNCFLYICKSWVNFQSSDWKSVSARWPPIRRPSCKLGFWVRLWAAICRHSPITICISTYSFTVPVRVEGWVDLGTAVSEHDPALTFGQFHLNFKMVLARVSVTMQSATSVATAPNVRTRLRYVRRIAFCAPPATDPRASRDITVQRTSSARRHAAAAKLRRGPPFRGLVEWCRIGLMTMYGGRWLMLTRQKSSTPPRSKSPQLRSAAFSRGQRLKPPRRRTTAAPRHPSPLRVDSDWTTTPGLTTATHRGRLRSPCRGRGLTSTRPKFSRRHPCRRRSAAFEAERWRKVRSCATSARAKR